MSKSNVYYCDNPNCDKTTNDLIENNWISFHNDNNNIYRGSDVLLANIDDANYCTLHCFIEHLAACEHSLFEEK